MDKIEEVEYLLRSLQINANDAFILHLLASFEEYEEKTGERMTYDVYKKSRLVIKG